MSDKIVVPEGMQIAFVEAMQDRFGSVPGGTAVGLEAALRWLSENPIVPTEQQSMEIFMLKAGFDFDLWEWVRWGACEWQRRMFLAPEPDDLQNEGAAFYQTSYGHLDTPETLRPKKEGHE